MNMDPYSDSNTLFSVFQIGSYDVLSNQISCKKIKMIFHKTLKM